MKKRSLLILVVVGIVGCSASKAEQPGRVTVLVTAPQPTSLAIDDHLKDEANQCLALSNDLSGHPEQPCWLNPLVNKQVCPDARQRLDTAFEAYNHCAVAIRQIRCLSQLPAPNELPSEARLLRLLDAQIVRLGVAVDAVLTEDVPIDPLEKWDVEPLDGCLDRSNQQKDDEFSLENTGRDGLIRVLLSLHAIDFERPKSLSRDEILRNSSHQGSAEKWKVWLKNPKDNESIRTLLCNVASGNGYNNTPFLPLGFDQAGLDKLECDK